MRIHRPILAALALLAATCGPPTEDPARAREREFEAGIIREATDRSRMTLASDASLRGAARDVALLLSAGFDGDVPETLRQAASARGALDPIPFLVYGASPTPDAGEILQRFQAGLASMPARERSLCTHVAAGVVQARRGDHFLSPRRWWVLLLVSQRALAYGTLPAELRPGDRFVFEGEIFSPFREPELLLTDPEGRVQRLDDLSSEQMTFRAYVHLGAGEGEYRLEVLGRDDMGPRVLGLGSLQAYGEGAVSPFAALLSAARSGSPLPALPGRYTAPPALDAALEEARLLALVNRDRRAAGVEPLVADGQLSAIARAHSEDMREHRFFAHISPHTGPPSERARAARIRYSRFAENIAMHRDVDGAEAALLHSPSHRANLLDPGFTHVGVGVAIARESDGSQRVYVTQDFAAGPLAE